MHYCCATECRQTNSRSHFCQPSASQKLFFCPIKPLLFLLLRLQVGFLTTNASRSRFHVSYTISWWITKISLAIINDFVVNLSIYGDLIFTNVVGGIAVMKLCFIATIVLAQCRIFFAVLSPVHVLQTLFVDSRLHKTEHTWLSWGCHWDCE